jgi:hypothetical protein
VLAHIKKELNNRTSDIVSIDKTSAIYQSNEQPIDELAGQQVDIESKIAKLAAKIADPRQLKVSKEDFLNLRVDNEKVAIYHWKEPFAALIALNELSYGGRGGT